jgi:hypothetical protein
LKETIHPPVHPFRANSNPAPLAPLHQFLKTNLQPFCLCRLLNL